MNRTIAALLFASLSPLSFGSAVEANVPQVENSEAAAALKQLFADSDEATLKRNPINALFRGDLRFADQLGDYVTDAYYDAERKAGVADLARLAKIDRNALSAIDKIAYDVFKAQTLLALRGLAPDILNLTKVRPIDHFSGFQTFYPDFASGQGAAPFATPQDYENNLKRHSQYVVLIDRAISRFREGMKSGIVQPKLVVKNVIDQLDLQIAQGVEGSTFYGPVRNFPATFDDKLEAPLRARYAAIIRDAIIPAHIRLRDFLKNEYLPVARDGVGLTFMKGGKALYNYQIASNTTLPLTADYVYKLGLSEVARIRRAMDAIRVETKFAGTLAQFFDFYRTDSQFQFKTKDEMQTTFQAIGRQVRLRVEEQFSTLPRAPLEIRAVPDYNEKTAAGGSYQQGTPDGTRPGTFFYNSYDLPSRSKPGSETLFLHEATPGHHFQISLAQENEALPAFMRFGGNTAYVEGWALYAESLYKELGVQSDPYARFGGLNDEMLRAMRLVVDSGLHAKGWTRERAIDYMLANSGMSKTDAIAEVERYIAIPGQALAYKIGQLTILRLKAKAMKELGSKFDPREFHAQVLMTGALPMTVLEQKINDWILATK
jgi:uncharacterized protein (DUF885 family)